MDKWSKKKASETCGGLGMSKYIDSNEARRLNRLKNIKSSITNKTSHNGWQRQQIEKRRKEQLRQRRKDAKKKQLGDGILVETKISKADAVSKCGLKLKVTAESTTQDVRERRAKGAESQGRAHKRNLPILVEHRARGPRGNGEVNDNDVGPRGLHSGPVQRPRRRIGVLDKRRGLDEGKENSDNSANNKNTFPDMAPSKGAGNAGGGRAVAPKKDCAGAGGRRFATAVDIDSLRREHADAIRMLEELDEREGDRRRSLDSADGSPHVSEDGSRDQYALHETPCEDRHRERNTLDDEFVRDCSNCDGAFMEEGGLPESFLNMSHLSISLQTEFDCSRDEADQNASKSKSSAREEESIPVPGPTKNRSFTSSYASVEESDYFGDSCSSAEEDDGYSSGTF